jgi:hypothetical protein
LPAQVELLVKSAVWSPLRFWRESNFNKIDVVLVVAAMVGAILQATGVLTRQISVAFSFFRFVRLVRILRIIPGFGLTVGAFADILPVLLQYGSVLLSSFYIFAVIGERAHPPLYTWPPPPPPPPPLHHCFSGPLRRSVGGRL